MLDLSKSPSALDCNASACGNMSQDVMLMGSDLMQSLPAITNSQSTFSILGLGFLVGKCIAIDTVKDELTVFGAI